jgi:sulfur relay (sulfurtransferase) complex TusBCD TusD component (DsrE family)
MAADEYGITEDKLITGIENGSMKALANWVKSSDNVLTF